MNMRKFIRILHSSCTRRRKSKQKRQQRLRNSSNEVMDTVDNLETNIDHVRSHEGITTVDTEEYCNLSSTSTAGSSVLYMSIFTWNMNGKASSLQDLSKLLTGGDGDRKLDLLVLGLQEVPRCNITRTLKEALAETHILVEKSIMQSLQLFVFVPKDYMLFITEVKMDKLSVGGFGGTLVRTKKGAVAISLKFKGFHLLFISRHLSGKNTSWTDRILFKIEKYGSIEATLHAYEWIDGIHSSDHKPVRAHLCLKESNNEIKSS
ncbi:hypothetical protein C5167_010759 [Papaver somniferum]|uniref:Inositol polyphosphate-related phosphatase domain-containing protein n=1 Tax=Papaver somniferum TaxID=3469 RepID=A0A4Y7K133_PAPSO|nr:hypothetical protein C5167_010759 [Papaver somniferum]